MNRIKCKKVAVVLLGYNSKSYLERFIPGILRTTYDEFDLVYVDNASTDDSVGFVETNFPEVKIFRIMENHGFTGGYTGSLPFIDAEYYVLLNSDVEVEPDWLTHLMVRMENNPNIGAMQPKLIHEPDRSIFDYAGASGGFIDKYGYPFCRGRIFDHIEKEKHQYDTPMPIFWASGACMLVKAKLYHQLGGLDNDFYAHMEEIDLCWRIKNAGFEIEVEPRSVVYHVGGSVITYGSYTKIYHNFRNNLVMLYKNLEPKKIVPILSMRLLLDAIAAFKALVSGRFVEFRAICMADLSFLLRIGQWKKNRKRARMHASRQPNTHGMYHNSIVFDFFLRGKKKFSDLTIIY